MTYTLYIGNKRYSSWSMRPWVLLKALHIPFDESLHFFQPGLQQPAFTAFSPSSKVPTLHVATSDSSDAVTIVWDSLAIVEYVADENPGVWPENVAARAFARSAAAEMHSGFGAIRGELPMNVGLRLESGPPGEPLQKDLDRLSALFKHGLEKFGGPWLAGKEFTAADAFYAPVATRLKTYGLKLRDGVAQEYMDRVFEHPAVKEWVEAGIRETAREPGHEEESLRGRKVLEDLSAAAAARQ
ncbi:glutathione S-transferase domain-containing protein [Sarocladium implicatum]|nr:glutathione S-transferase domain-containing protein [Sarocladium implicatum]